VRYQQSQQTHLVTFTCYRWLRHLDDPATRDLVVAALEQARLHYRFRVYGFVIMPEHVHLLVSEPDRGLLANAIQSFKIASAKCTTQERRLDGHRSPLWQKILRLQHPRLSPVHRETALHSPQPAATRAGTETRRLDLEQLSSLSDRRTVWG
jgi:REP element-mobilizing transposase RayT